MNIDNRTKKFIDLLQQAYFIDRDMQKVLSYVSPNVLWSGICNNELLIGYNGFKQCFALEIEKHPDPFIIDQNIVSTFSLSETLCLAQGYIRISDATSRKTDGRGISMSFSLSCLLVDDHMELLQLHFSEIEASRKAPNSFSDTITSTSAHELQNLVDQTSKALKAREEDLKHLTQNIPGGIFRCVCNEPLTILQASDGFIKLFGYSREELESRFNNSFRAMIDPRDLEPTQKEVDRQLAISNTKQIEYRVHTKNGKTIWVLDKGILLPSEEGESCFYCILIDITFSKQAQDKLRLSLDRHQIIMNQTNDIIFEWDILSDCAFISPNWEKKFGSRPITENFFKNLDKNPHIRPSDVSNFRDALNILKNGMAYTEAEVCIYSQHTQSYLWCRIRMTTQYDSNQKALKVVGVILDIDHAKKQSQELLEKAERDTLTKLYNKGTAETMIANMLKETPNKKPSALLIIDIDNFKTVNDSKGHLFGDTFLMEIAGKIQALFRRTDVVGRIGGDEFIAYLENLPSIQVAEEKASQVVEIFHHLEVFKTDQNRTSCSIGIACSPENGTDFKTLYKKADYALYQAKNQGKNQFVVYDGTTDDSAVKDVALSLPSAVSSDIDSNNETLPQTVHSQLVEYVFRILYKSIDIETAVQLILEIIALQFDVSRAYIFENTEDDTHCENTFEWCGEGIEPQIDTLTKIPYKTSDGNYQEYFDKNGIFYCRDIAHLPKAQYNHLEPKGIKSMLQCAIRDNGVFKGYVGFDECRKNRFWTEEQITSLSFIAEILSTFLLKKRAQDRLEQSLLSMEEVLNNQNAWIYVIEPNTYKMLYINDKTRKIATAIHVGMTCHAAFFGSDIPCDHCPATHLNQDTINHSLDVYNPTLGVWTSVDASTIVWKNKTAWLLCCHDISRYVQ